MKTTHILVVTLVTIVACFSASAAATPDFVPTKSLRGKRIRSKGMSVVIPTGWRTRWTTQAGTDVLAVQRPRASADGVLLVARHYLSPQQRRGVASQLLAREVRRMVGNAPVKVVLAPQQLRVASRGGARLIVNTTTARGTIEIYAATVLIDGWAFVFLGAYDQAKAGLFRPALETMLASLRGRPPRENYQLRRKLSRCWQHYTFSSSGNGSGSSTTTLRLAADGSYTYRYSMSVMGASRRSHSRGTWTVFGNRIVTTPNDGSAVVTYAVTWKGLVLYLNGTKYLPC